MSLEVTDVLECCRLLFLFSVIHLMKINRGLAFLLVVQKCSSKQWSQTRQGNRSRSRSRMDLWQQYPLPSRGFSLSSWESMMTFLLMKFICCTSWSVTTNRCNDHIILVCSDNIATTGGIFVSATVCSTKEWDIHCILWVILTQNFPWDAHVDTRTLWGPLYSWTFISKMIAFMR